MKKITFTITLIFSVAILFAQHVSRDEAERVAVGFFQSKGQQVERLSAVFFDNTDTLLYIFNSDKAFVAVAGDKRVPPVLAFSDHNRYNADDVIAPAQMWLDHYKTQIADLKKNNSHSAENSFWAKFLRKGEGFHKGGEVEPLVKSHWGQGVNYNYYCPRDVQGDNNRVVTGCVATAMAQLIYYFRYPQTGVGSYSYLDSTYGVQAVDYGATTYNYEAMCDDPIAINTEISKLIYNFGVGVDMVYGPDGSGMYNHSAARVLRSYFKYDPQTEYLYRDSTNLNWDSVIVAHLDKEIPMYYAGWSLPNINGHGFVCDGYKLMDSCYYFHFNFGWDGAYDGYFYTDHLNVGGHNFNLAQELIVNAVPDTTWGDYLPAIPLTGSKTLTATSGSFTDGSLASAFYKTDMDFTWTIQPASEHIESISLDLNYQIAAGDTLRISAPTVNESYVLTSDSGHLHLSWDCVQIVVRFTSDDTLSSNGFRANYYSSITDFCPTQSNYTTPTGTITDGSGLENYSNLATCVSRIILPSYSAISLHVVSLDMEDGKDKLYIYKFPFKNENLLTTLTGTMSDTTLLFDEKRLVLCFESDEQNTAAGFEITYEGGHVGVATHTNPIEIWPNPTSEVLHLRAEQPIGIVTISDMQGRKVFYANFENVQETINLSSLSNGIYMIQMEGVHHQITRKFIKQ